MVTKDWYWEKLDLAYRLVLETFGKNLMAWLAYRVLSGVDVRARIGVCFTLIAV